jgi:hypothetical protein
MSIRPYRFRTAIWYAFSLWIIGFIWGIIVFTIPALKNGPTLRYISKYPAISGSLIVLYFITTIMLSKNFLRLTSNKAREGLKLGATFFLLNIGLDILVYVILFASSDYFSYISIWFVYAIFIVVPWISGRIFEESRHP